MSETCDTCNNFDGVICDKSGLVVRPDFDVCDDFEPLDFTNKDDRK